MTSSHGRTSCVPHGDEGGREQSKEHHPTRGSPKPLWQASYRLALDLLTLEVGGKRLAGLNKRCLVPSWQVL